MTSVPQAPRRWRIGSLRGVPIYLSASWLVIAAATTFLLGPTARVLATSSTATGYAVAFAFAVLLLASVLVHEAAHALVARGCGYRVSRIVADFWGGHTAYDGAHGTPGKEALVAMAGPAGNIVLAALGWLVLQPLEQGVGWLLVAAFTAANAFVGAFNLLPGLPLDGGFLVDSLVWKVTGSRGTGTLVAGWCGRLLVLALVGWVILLPVLRGDPPTLGSVLWAGLIGVFLWAGASGAVRTGRARRSLEGVRVQDVCRPVGVVGETFGIEQVPWAQRAVWLVADPRGRVTGLVDGAALSQVPPTRAAVTTVGAVTRRQPEGWVVQAAPTDDLSAVVLAMQTHQTPLIAVCGPDGTVRGVITADDL